MSDEKEPNSPSDFEAMAYGVFTGSNSVDGGRAALLDAYNSRDWQDKDAAAKTLEYYGEQLPYKFQSKETPLDPETYAPVKVLDAYRASEVPDTNEDGSPKVDASGNPITKHTIQNDTELYDKWEELNTDYLKNTSDPQLLVARKDIQKSVADTATAKRKEVFNRSKDTMLGDGILGSIADTAYNTAVQVTKGVVAPVEWAIDAVTPKNFELNKYLTERSDPEFEQSFGGQLAAAVGNVGTTVAAGVVGGAPAIAGYLGGGAIDQVVQRYNKTKEQTGDPSKARSAAAVETASQAVQFTAQELGLGAVANKITGAVTSEGARGVFKTLFSQGIGSGTGRAISNVAENIQEKNPALDKVGRGIGTAAAVGAIAGGLAGAAGEYSPKKSIGTDTSNDRSQEVDELGVPLSATTKQRVGDNASETPPPEANETITPNEAGTQSGEEPVIDTGAQVEKIPAPEFDIDADGNPVEYTPPPPAQEQFTLEDGSVYLKNASGQLFKRDKNGVEQSPFDATKFINPEQAAELDNAFSTGDAHAILTPENKVELRSTDGSNKLIKEIPTSDIPTPDSHVLDISADKFPNKQEIIRPIRVGPRVKYITENKSIGAAGPAATTKLKESTYSQRLRGTESAPDFMKKAGEEGIFYPVLSRKDMNAELDSMTKQGVGPLIDYFLSTPKDRTSGQDTNIATYLSNYFLERHALAAAAKDQPALERIESDFARIKQHISDKKTIAGQSLSYARGDNLDSMATIIANRKNTFETTAKEEAAAQGIPLDDVLNIDRGAAAIKLLKDQIDQAQKSKTKDGVKPEKTEADKVLDSQVKDLEQKQAKAEKVRKIAEDKALETTRAVAENEQQIKKLQDVVDTIPEANTQRKIKAEIAARRAAFMRPGETINKVPLSDILNSAWYVNVLTGIWNVGVNSITSALLGSTKLGVTGLLDAYNGAKAVLAGSEYKSVFLGAVKELLSTSELKRAGQLGLDALYGERIGSTFRSKDVQVEPYSSAVKNINASEGDQYHQLDFLNRMRNTPYEKLPQNATPKQRLETSVRNTLIGISKLSAQTAGRLVRLIPMVESAMGVLQNNAAVRAAANFHFNELARAKAQGREITIGTNEKGTTITRPVSDADLQEYMFNTKENRIKAKAFAADKAQKLRDAGVKFTPREERTLEEEVYQSLPPRNVGIDAYKQITQLNFNGLPSGLSGFFAQHLNRLMQSIGNLPVPGSKLPGYLVRFNNSIATQIGAMLELTPFGSLVGFQIHPDLRRTQFERQMAIGTSILGSVAAGSILAWWTEEQKKPAEERNFDIIGKYSTDKKKADAFVQSGGLKNSFVLGSGANKVYVPFSESAFGLLLGTIGAYADRHRDGLDTDTGVTGNLTIAAMTAIPTTLGQVSMLKGITGIAEGIMTIPQDPDKGATMIARTIAGTVKGFIPASGLLRTISRFTDNPTDAYANIKSAMVEGIPFVQSAYGEPALNIFGEKLPSDGERPGIHRIFSLQNADLDIRWLVENGYTIPNIDSIKVSKKEAIRSGTEPGQKLSKDVKREILKDAGPDMRATVAQYRSIYGLSTPDDRIQKSLNSKINKILTRSTISVLRDNSVSVTAEAELPPLE